MVHRLLAGAPLRATARRHWAALVLLVLLVACGDGSSWGRQAELRVVNAMPGAVAFDLLVGGVPRAAALGYGQASGYVAVDPERARTDWAEASSGAVVLSLEPALAAGGRYSLVVFGTADAPQAVLIDDAAPPPVAGKAALRVVNTSSQAPRVDVYVDPADDAAPGNRPAVANAAFGQPSEPVAAFAAGGTTSRLRVTAAGAPNDLRLRLADLRLPETGVATLVITPSTGGVLVGLLQLDAGRDALRRDNPEARVRAVAPNRGVHTARVGEVPLLESAAAPVVGDYVLVPAGSPQAVSVVVDGRALVFPDVVLDSGTDQTLLVYRNHRLGDDSLVAWLADDNRAPADPAAAKVRLVHGYDTNGTSLYWFLGHQFNGYVRLPGASGYVDIAAGAAVPLTVLSADDSIPLFAASPILENGAVYSVFAVGGAVVWRDRAPWPQERATVPSGR